MINLGEIVPGTRYPKVEKRKKKKVKLSSKVDLTEVRPGVSGEDVING